MKLGPIRSPKPIRMSIVLPPELKFRLDRYTRWHGEIFNEEVDPGELFPHILEAFLNADTAFRKVEKASLTKQAPGPQR